MLRSINQGRFLVRTRGDIKSENTDISNKKSCEKHDRLLVEGFLRLVNLCKVTSESVPKEPRIPELRWSRRIPFDLLLKFARGQFQFICLGLDLVYKSNLDLISE